TNLLQLIPIPHRNSDPLCAIRHIFHRELDVMFAMRDANYNDPHPLEYWSLQSADYTTLNICADRMKILDYEHFVTLHKRLDIIFLLIHFPMNSSSHPFRMRSAARASEAPG